MGEAADRYRAVVGANAADKALFNESNSCTQLSGSSSSFETGWPCTYYNYVKHQPPILRSSVSLG